MQPVLFPSNADLISNSTTKPMCEKKLWKVEIIAEALVVGL